MKIKFGYKSLAVFTAVVLGSLAVQPAQAQQLSQEQVTQLIVGKCVDYWGPTQGRECYKKNGRVTFDDKQDGKGQGRYVIDSGRICNKYEGDPETYCNKVVKMGDNTYNTGAYTWRVAN